MIRLVMFAFLVVGSASAAMAAPPPGSDPDGPLARWFESLRNPTSGMMCCSLADCRPVDYRIGAGHYEVRLRRSIELPDPPARWFTVPDDRVIRHHDNPTGEAIACYYIERDESRITNVNFYCFLPEWGT
jgi:hypothetical protein